MKIVAFANTKLNNRTIRSRVVAGVVVAGFLTLGAAIQFAWLLFYDQFHIPPSEAFNLGAAFGKTGELADAWGPATGLSAHLSPGMPVLVGTVYRWLGVGTPAAEFVLSSISLAFFCTAILALNAAFEMLSVAPLARIGAIALLCLLPFHMSLEMGEFRYWEGSLAAAGIAVCLARALKLDDAKGPPSWFDLSVLAVGVGVLSLFSEAGALACYGIIGWLALQTRGWLGFAGMAAISAILLAAILYPWALRNEAVFGDKVWTRTAFGINFAQGFHDKALDRADPRKVFNDRLDEVSPFTGPAALAEMRRVGGEAAYSRLLTRTLEWIRKHPLASLGLAARHVWEFYVQPRWMWGSNVGLAVVKQGLAWTSTILGFAGLVMGLARSGRRYVYFAAALLLPVLPYITCQPILRYQYPVLGLIVFLAADALFRAASFLSNRPSPSRPSASDRHRSEACAGGPESAGGATRSGREEATPQVPSLRR